MRFVAPLDDASERYEVDDPHGFSEAEFETLVRVAAPKLFPDYRVCPFRVNIRWDADVRQPDLAFLHRLYAHWFIVEVEMVSHSLHHHVLPQVRAFQYGDIESGGARTLADGLQIPLEQARTLIDRVPRSVAVIANRRDASWEHALAAVPAQLVTVASFQSKSGQRLVGVDGDLTFLQRHIGWAQYDAAGGSLRLARAAWSIRSRVVEIFEDEAQSVSGFWTVREDGRWLWLIRERGTAPFVDGEMVQIVELADGRARIRRG